MSKDTKQKEFDVQRNSPRVAAAIDVDVEVAGEKQKVLLVSKDIGAGGMFLRTSSPAPLWKKVVISFVLPSGVLFEVSGEVVRSLTTEKAKQSGSPAGMAIAFDEVSRPKRKELVALVLDLCAQRRPRKPKEPKAEAAEAVVQEDTPDTKTRKADVETDAEQKKEDELLNEIDSLLDSVENEIENQTEEISEDLDDEVDLELSSEMIEITGETEPEPEISVEIDAEPAVDSDEDQEASLRVSLSEYRQSLSGDTYYHLLGVGLQAGPNEIENAYKELLSQFKPPAPPDSFAPDLLQQLSSVLGKIRKAFAILSKPDRKRAYDFLIDNDTDDF